MKRGPKPSGRRSRLSSLSFNDAEWSAIKLSVARSGLTIAARLRHVALVAAIRVKEEKANACDPS